MTERLLMRAIQDALSGRLALWRNNVGVDTQRGVRYGLGLGSPDLIGCMRGEFIGFEVKTARGVVSDDQARWHEHARSHGARVYVVRSVEEAIDALKRY